MSRTNEILNARAKTHGEYRDHARVTQNIKRCMESEPGWLRLNDMQREALSIIAHKIGRILSGNPDFHDHWIDISGYAVLVAERIPQQELFQIPEEDKVWRIGTPADGAEHARYQED